MRGYYYYKLCPIITCIPKLKINIDSHDAAKCMRVCITKIIGVFICTVLGPREGAQASSTFGLNSV